MVKAWVSRQVIFVQILDRPFVSFMTLGTLFSLSAHQFPLIYLMGVL